MKKMEERNFSISNAKRRWHFLKNSTLKVKQNYLIVLLIEPAILPVSIMGKLKAETH
jgi:hypothetical protein